MCFTCVNLTTFANVWEKNHQMPYITKLKKKKKKEKMRPYTY